MADDSPTGEDYSLAEAKRVAMIHFVRNLSV